MSKRCLPISNEQNKRPKLEPNRKTIFLGVDNSSKQDEWGDENEDEILLLASQACEQAVSTDVSILPDYEAWNKPSTSSTSTQHFHKPPDVNLSSTDNLINPSVDFEFQKPMPKCHMDIVNGCKLEGSTNDQLYEIVKRLQAEKAKYKQENVHLLEQCLTREGEASILRSQLKSKEATVDRARMEKCMVEQSVKMEWNEKLAAALKELSNFKTQLEFKELELFNLKERCRTLESNKFKLSQQNNLKSNETFPNFRNMDYTLMPPAPPSRKDTSIRKEKNTQTVSHNIMKLIAVRNDCPQKHREVLLDLLKIVQNKENKSWQPNKKTVSHVEFAQPQYGMHNLYHQIAKDGEIEKLDLSTLTHHFVNLSRSDFGWACKEIYIRNILIVVANWINIYSNSLKCQYEERPPNILRVSTEQLLAPEPLLVKEEAIPLRQICTVILELCLLDANVVRMLSEPFTESPSLLDSFHNFGEKLAKLGCSKVHCGFLISMIYLLKLIIMFNHDMKIQKKNTELLKNLISSKPPDVMLSYFLELLVTWSTNYNLFESLCSLNISKNEDMEETRKTTSCPLKMIFKRSLTYLKSFERGISMDVFLKMSEDMLTIHCKSFHGNLKKLSFAEGKNKCQCILKLIQIIVYVIYTTAEMMFFHRTLENKPALFNKAKSICTGGAMIVISWSLLDTEFNTHLHKHEGCLQKFVHLALDNKELLCLNETLVNSLADLKANHQSNTEDGVVTTAHLEDVCLRSLESFHISD